jgi:hypothetical protein
MWGMIREQLFGLTPIEVGARVIGSCHRCLNWLLFRFMQEVTGFWADLIPGTTIKARQKKLSGQLIQEV